MRKQQTKSVKVSEVTKEWLKRKKKEGGFSSMDALLRSVFKMDSAEVEGNDRSGSDGEEDFVPDKKRKLDVRPALITTEFVLDRRGMLQLFTGLDAPVRDDRQTLGRGEV